MKKSGLVFIVAICIISGCTTQRQIDWQATGGSRSDGSIKLSIQYPNGVKPILNETQAINEATRKCAAWGYMGTEAFGGIIRTCSQYGSGFATGVCVGTTTVTKEYQCTTTKESEL